MTLSTIILAVALAMDAFAVAIGTGVALQRVDRRQTFRMAWHFGLFQALMPIAGWFLGRHVSTAVQAYDHWVAFGLLAFVGGRMILERPDDESETLRRDPTRGVTLVLLSVATSIDALAVGLSMAVLHIPVWGTAAVIGVVAAAFTALGLHMGKWIGRARALGRFAEIAGGLVLIGIGARILLDHGVFDTFMSLNP